MIIFIHTKTKAKVQKVERIDTAHYQVSVKEPPVSNKANCALIRTLSDYFKIPQSCIEIISGKSSKRKVIKII